VEKPVPQAGTGAAEIRRYLESTELGALVGRGIAGVEFLARGEYSLNYRIRRASQGGEPDEDLVARLITGSQMNLPLGEQALYEHHALGLLAPSEVTPKPYRVNPEPEGLPYPLILEEYLPGRPLSYATDITAAARCIAKVHGLGVPQNHRLQEHPDPAPSILAESRELVIPYLSWEGAPKASQEALCAAFQQIEGFLEQKGLFSKADLAIVNYDLNTHNFIVEGGEAKLVDWEKARIAPRTQDVAHFLLPTTTLWRDATAARLTPEQEAGFVETYLSRSSIEDTGRFRVQLQAMRIIVSLRAVSWCAWVLQETARRGRIIINEETLNKSRTYLKPIFLRELFGI
jgi:aminoglycoside phosphotransferase (APT) family kinase protein